MSQKLKVFRIQHMSCIQVQHDLIKGMTCPKLGSYIFACSAKSVSAVSSWAIAQELIKVQRECYHWLFDIHFCSRNTYQEGELMSNIESFILLYVCFSNPRFCLWLLCNTIWECLIFIFKHSEGLYQEDPWNMGSQQLVAISQLWGFLCYLILFEGIIFFSVDMVVFHHTNWLKKIVAQSGRTLNLGLYMFLLAMTLNEFLNWI